LSLGRDEDAVVDGYSPGVTHQEVFIVIPFPTFHHGAMNVGDHGLSACNLVLKFGNDGTGFSDVVTNVRSNSTRASWRRRW